MLEFTLEVLANVIASIVLTIIDKMMHKDE